jgi:predicted HicB family RNase H-like nuclease
MAKKKRRRREEPEEGSKTKRAPGPPRMNLGVPKKTYHKVQVAAAVNNMEVNDWIRAILSEASRRKVEKYGID